MAIIENIADSVIDEHVAWHGKPGDPEAGGRIIDPWPRGAREQAPGSGEEFLIWHQGYLNRFHKWVAKLPANDRPNAQSISPWSEVPSSLKMNFLGWNSALANDVLRLQDMSNFSSLDELGRFLEGGLHGFMHMAGSRLWEEPVLGTMASPRSTYFYQLHGLIDKWREEWVEHNKKQISSLRVFLEDFHKPEGITPIPDGPAPQPWPQPFPEPIPWPRPWPWPFPDPFPPIDPRGPFGPNGPKPNPEPVVDFSSEEIRLVKMFRDMKRR